MTEQAKADFDSFMAMCSESPFAAPLLEDERSLVPDNPAEPMGESAEPADKDEVPCLWYEGGEEEVKEEEPIEEEAKEEQEEGTQIEKKEEEEEEAYSPTVVGDVDLMESELGAQRGTKRPYSQQELLDLQAERAEAERRGLRWQERGPPGPKAGGPKTWRGQQYREGSGKWANRGGKWKDFYSKKYGPGGWAWKCEPGDKGKGKGKGKSQGKGKSSDAASSSSGGASSSSAATGTTGKWGSYPQPVGKGGYK